MGVSYASVDPTSMELTPMRVDFKAPGATDFTDLGGTLGNVSISFKYAKADIKADQFGDKTVLDRRINGLEITVTTELAEIKDFTNVWKTVFPHSTLSTSGSDHSIEFDSKVGDSDLSNAGVLRLHPLSVTPSDDETYNYYFWKACATAESDAVYSPKDQTKLKIVWNVLPDTSTTPARFAKFGKTSV
jgi:hypothetical protein